MNPIENSESRPRLAIGRGSVLATVVIFLGFYAVSEHAAHALVALPYLILLLCPLMHFLMHRGGHNESHKVIPGQGSDKE